MSTQAGCRYTIHATAWTYRSVLDSDHTFGGAGRRDRAHRLAEDRLSLYEVKTQTEALDLEQPELAGRTSGGPRALAERSPKNRNLCIRQIARIWRAQITRVGAIRPEQYRGSGARSRRFR